MMEEVLFLETKVAKSLSKGYVEARLHTDRMPGPEKDAIIALQQKLAGSKALPTLIIYDPTSEKVVAKSVGGMQEKPFLDFLAQGRKR